MNRWFSGSLAALRAALAEPRLRRVQIAWAGSTSGEFVSIVALGLFAYEVGGATAVGVIALVQMVPSMLFSPIAGVLSDRLSRELFGEMALLRNAPRNATVRAVRDSRVYQLERSEFLAAVTGHPVSSLEATDLVATRLELRRRTLGEG